MRNIYRDSDIPIHLYYYRDATDADATDPPYHHVVAGMLYANVMCYDAVLFLNPLSSPSV